MGISPLRYRDFFEEGRRKDKAAGKVIRWAGGIGVPIVEIYHPVYISLETIVSSKLKEDKRLSEKPPIAWACGFGCMGGDFPADPTLFFQSGKRSCS